MVQPQLALADLIASTLHASSLDNVLRDALPILCGLLAIQHCTVLEWNPDPGTVVVRSASGWPATTLGQIILDRDATKRAAASTFWNDGAAVYDWATERRFSQPPLLRDAGIVASLAAPMESTGQFFGFVVVHSTTRRVWTDDDAALLRAAANTLALGAERFKPDRVNEEHLQIRLRAQERQHLARELHDSVTQALFGVTLHAEAASRLLSFGDTAVAAGYLRDLQATAQEALDEMRLLIFELRPQILEQEGLVAALQDRLDAVEGRANVQASFEVHDERRLPIEVEQALYRIAREALNNILKHAHARTIRLAIRYTSSSVAMEIMDDGDGFDTEAARERGGMGLRGITERVEQLGGRLTLTSAPGTGTALRIEVGV